MFERLTKDFLEIEVVTIGDFEAHLQIKRTIGTIILKKGMCEVGYHLLEKTLGLVGSKQFKTQILCI